MLSPGTGDVRSEKLVFEFLQSGIDIYRSGGPTMYPLGLLSVVAVAIILERLWVLRRSNYLEQGTVHVLSGLLGGRDYKAATDYCRRHPGPFTELVHTMVENRHAPYDELKEILGDTGRRQLMGLQRGLAALATIVGGAPLLGLLGTVLGMIAIFKAVATGGTGITEQLATGIKKLKIGYNKVNT